MKIHYFQRYHAKENVATANAMLLLSRLYSYSSDKFYRFLKSQYFTDSFDPEITFNLQEKSKESVPDATITQESFKIVVETKMSKHFNEEQLLSHVGSFSDEKHKVLLTLAPEYMESVQKQSFEDKLKIKTAKDRYPVIHINTTFEELTNGINDVLDDRDYEMLEVLDDFLEYCYKDNLIPEADAWKYMRVKLAGTTLAFNKQNNVYYDRADRGYRAHNILGLYNRKSVRAIGKVVARIIAVEVGNDIKYTTEFGELTNERKSVIKKAMSDGDTHGYDLRSIEHKYFFVDKFYETDFKKITKGAPMGSRVFDLTQVLQTDDIPEVKELAEILKNKTWE